MFNKIKATFFGIFLFFISLAVVPQSADAALYQFDAVNHPSWGNYAGQGPGGLFVSVGGWQVFGFVDVKLTFDTNTETGLMSGSILHHLSGETWHMEYSMSNPNVTGSAFEDAIISLLDPTTNPGQQVTFSSQYLKLTTNVVNPTYQAYTESEGKMNSYVRHDHYINDFNGGSGWFKGGGDIHYGFVNGRRVPPVVPEPSTMVMLGMGVAGAFVLRKKK